VLDAEKAKPLFDRNVPPHLIHARSGAKVVVPSSPKIGPMRSRTMAPRAFVLFSNPGQLVSSGDEVAVVIGAFRAEKLVVQ
jgi:hypothetical protein